MCHAISWTLSESVCTDPWPIRRCHIQKKLTVGMHERHVISHARLSTSSPYRRTHFNNRCPVPCPNVRASMTFSASPPYRCLLTWKYCYYLPVCGDSFFIDDERCLVVFIWCQRERRTLYFDTGCRDLSFLSCRPRSCRPHRPTRNAVFLQTSLTIICVGLDYGVFT